MKLSTLSILLKKNSERCSKREKVLERKRILSFQDREKLLTVTIKNAIYKALSGSLHSSDI